MTRRLLRLTAAAFLLLTFASQALPQAPTDGKVSFRRDVAPILKRHCLSCHTKSDPEGDFSVDTVALMAKGGKSGPGFKAGKPDESLVIQMVTGVKKPTMPAKSPPLPPAKIETLRQWIAAGAKDDSEPSSVVEKIVIPQTYRVAPAVTAVAFSPDGKHVAAACRSEVVVLPVDGPAEPRRLPTDSDLITCVAFSPDGQTLVAAGGSPSMFGEVRFFETTGEFKLRATRRVGKDTLFRGGFAPDGKHLVFGGADGAVYVVPNSATGEVRRFELHSDWVSAAAFSADGRLLISGSRDKTVKVTLLETGKLLRSIATSADYVNAVAATPTFAISGGRDRTPATYDLKLSLGDVVLKGSGNDVTPDRPSAQYTRRLEAQAGEIMDLSLDAARTKLAVAGSAGEVRVYNVADGRRLATLTAVPAPVYAVALSADGTRVATGSYTGQVGIYDAATGKMLKQLVPVPVAAK